MTTTTISPNSPGLDKSLTVGREITASAARFVATAAASSLIATLDDPFGSGSTFTTVGDVPAQLALSGSTIVKGAGAAVLGARYDIKVRATSANGRDTKDTVLSFRAGYDGGGPYGPLINLALSAATFIAGAAAGTLIGNITNVPAGATPVFTPNDGRVAVAGDATNGWKLVVGLTAASAGTIAGTITAAGASPLAVSLTVTAGRVLRSGAYGTTPFNTKDATGAAQWSDCPRDQYSVPWNIKQGDILEFGIPYWTLERPANATVFETDLADPYEFALNFEYPYNPSATTALLANISRCLTPDGSVSEVYTPGQAKTFGVWRVAAPADIPANTPFGLHIPYDCIPGRSGAVTSKLIRRPGGGSNFMGRNGGYSAGTSSRIQANATTPRTTFTADDSSQTGTAKSLRVGGMRSYAPAGTPNILCNENSLGEGPNEGRSFSGTFGDIGGDAQGNKGYFARFCRMVGLALTNMSRGSDRISYRMVADNMRRRDEFTNWLACGDKIKVVEPNPHNEVGWANAPAWAASTPYALDDTVLANGKGFLCVAAGTSGTTAPDGTGANIADGAAVKWTYIGPNDMAGAPSAIGWVSGLAKYIRARRAAVPGYVPFAPTCPPDCQEPNPLTSVTSYSYDATTGALSLELPAGYAAKMFVGSRIRIAGLTPSGMNASSTAAVTAISGNFVTVTRATGLAAPTGTAKVNMMWAQPEWQTINAGGYSAGTSFRTWCNRFYRTLPNNPLGIAGVLDLGRATELGGATTPETETGKWDVILEAGQSLGAVMTEDGIHQPSWGCEIAAQRIATNDTAALAALKAVA
ncbi:hypothetical protein [Aureimonas leprariae]|uniref:Uncharacterized protein n=1 Tax=Plantimonas leprariae TaxID=2615207 RepID=A0A7V7PSA6_9HYPH|nr:hypothetical protein [Aureimonas leprariae]KAB0682008.1 hypothetical protein F6X38_04165 [Aureimonas leprariae]